MKRNWKLFLMMGLAFLLTGCRAAEPAPTPVVEQIRVTCHRGQAELTRSYTQEDKLQRILYHLRQQDYDGYAKNDPERLAGDDLRMELLFSDGTCRIYRQRCDRYLSRDLHRWRNIPQEQGKRLRYLLYLMESDAVANGAAS